MKANLVVATGMLLALIGCGEEKPRPGYSAGSFDGSAAAINTICHKTFTLIHGAWHDPEYARGFAEGTDYALRRIAEKGCGE